MILYKYVSFEVARLIIDSASIGFSCAEDLNDPFECTAFGFMESKNSRVATYAYRGRLSRQFGVLSLTRQPLNAIMWAHYGCAHQGVVVGFDSVAAGFEHKETSIIPSQYGEVIYTSSKPVNISIPNIQEMLTVGNEITDFRADYYNIIKRAFLYKSLEWGHEEEVRVVKNIKSNLGYHGGGGKFTNPSGEWMKIMPPTLGRPVYCLSIPDSSIVEVYLGTEVYKNVSRLGSYTREGLDEILQSWNDKGIEVLKCEVDHSSWRILASKRNVVSKN
ncbi:DUF2971 domain-containing protein [Desulfopila sp. IMCC35008]|uniref:DUF2971 domain-containing protein n=1 Tax=Desulfopila sp. IMCC35008 TaxID=2653858 RepID=UPI0013D5E7B8|nr:DUF2971 domain-containing protein [Desulfopila sp. IMCC35008]